MAKRIANIMKLRTHGLLTVLGFAYSAAWGALPPTDLPGLRFTDPFFPGVEHRSSIPSPRDVLGFPLAERAATPAEVERCLRTWTAAAPDRTRLVEYARSHEGRPLHYMVVTSPPNLQRVDRIQEDLARLGDPRRLTEEEAAELIDRVPAVAWLAYTIHGDETEGSDAALAVLPHLLAAEDPKVDQLLEDLVIIIDPLMNPDGRARFLKMIAEHRGQAPNVDDQSLLHRGYWPRGRGNHYLFDLNRDWILCRHPETRGRVEAVREWNPQLFVDAHGMGSQETHLFSPPREPINPNIPTARDHWSQLFARDQAAAFDQHHLLYYSGEWHEEWYPGYSDAWASYRGAIGILYEQARVAEDAVRRPEGRLLSYRESVRHHVIGSFANLATLQTNRRDVLRYFHQSRKDALDPEGAYAKRTFAIPPTANRGRLLNLLNILQLQGFELFQLEESITAPAAVDQLGDRHEDLSLPVGTVLIPARQPLGRAVAGTLEFDPRFRERVLAKERREILRTGNSKIYDVTSWNLTMMFGLPAFEVAMDLPVEAESYRMPEPAPDQGSVEETMPVAWVLDGADDRSVTAAARLMECGVEVRGAIKSFRFDDHDFARGSIVITPIDNRSLADTLAQTVYSTARETGQAVHKITSGQGAGELPDLGSEHFRRLAPPRLAILGRDNVSSSEFGAVWYVIDQRLGIRHSHLTDLTGADLRRYNVLVIPPASEDALTGDALSSLKTWVQEGGTLIAMAEAARSIASTNSNLGEVRLLPEILEDLAGYEIAVLREWLASEEALPSLDSIWSHGTTMDLTYPWPSKKDSYPDKEELRRRDKWQQLFMPQGTFLASRVDTNSWLTCGTDRPLPVLVGNHPVLMSASGVETPVRYGWIRASEGSDTSDRSDEPDGSDKSDKSDETPRLGWSVLPPNTELRLRMSGLLWPEASHRLANAAYLTREKIGRGQVILFAAPPTFRAATEGTTRLFLNAVVFGPGCGTAVAFNP
jgi:hypothetical protein